METRDLSTHETYIPGRGPEAVAEEHGLDPDDIAVLSSNENPLGPSADAVEAIREHAPDSAAYPKAAHAELTHAVADHWHLAPDQVWLAPGSDGAFDYLARAVLSPGDRVLAPQPGFAYYRMSARYHHGTVDRYHLHRGQSFDQSPETILDAYDGHRIVYVNTPHNPTGTEIRADEVGVLADRVDDDTLVVVDEAYAEYTGTASARQLIDSHENVAVTRTFSKAYGLAGLRVGYALVPESWADAYELVNTPFAANALACRAARAALADGDHLDRCVGTARWARSFLREELDATTWPSGGNFVLVEVGDATAVTNALEREGVLVRDCTSFGLDDCVRVTCGTRAETRRAVDALGAAFGEE